MNFRYFLAFYRLLGLSDQIMERFAKTRAHLRRRGQRIADFDLLIAATALRHFERVPALKLYQPS